MLELKQVYKSIKGKPIIKGVSFLVNKGEIVGFIGDNGAGKTTTIKLIFSEIELDHGSINYKGEDITKNNALSKLAFFPDNNSIPNELTVKEYVSYLFEMNTNNKQNEKDKTVNKLIKIMSIDEHSNKKIGELSSGLKKRAIMAGVLINKPEFMIFDEPTANLDVESKIEFIKLIKLINSLGVTIMITSHIIEELQEIINHLIIIKSGEIVYDAKFNNKSEKISKIYENYIAKNIIDFEGVKDIYE